jgi:hypothetical protein
MFKLKIKTDNAAFSYEGTDDRVLDQAAAACEVARILRVVASGLENGESYGRCMDVNGNGVGEWSIK